MITITFRGDTPHEQEVALMLAWAAPYVSRDEVNGLELSACGVSISFSEQEAGVLKNALVEGALARHAPLK